jgi:hypothetical protein
MSSHPYDADPGLANRAKINNGRIPIELSYPLWTHPQVLENAQEWQTIRDCVAGERIVKLNGTEYLRPLDEMSAKEYAAYLDRAVFFNMTGRTVNALTGIVFNRSPQIGGVPKKLEKAFRLPTRNNISFNAFLKKVCRELIAMGRYGVLLDMDPAPGPNAVPYFVGFAAEHILDWQETVIDGRLVPTEVVLREVREVRGATFGAGRTIKTTYRRLALEWSAARNNFIYVQWLYEVEGVTIDVENVVPKRIVPTRNGVPFNRIPFIFLGAIDNTPDIDRSPVADIASLNIAHYRSYAQLEHSRFFTAMPVFYAQVPTGAAEPTYRVGSSVVWEVAPGEKPGILEMNGHGLNGLVDACEQKEDQISALGGRLMSAQSRSTAESDNALKLKEGNERSILLNIVFSVSDGMTELLRQWLWWAGVDDPKDVEVELNKEFLTDTLGARELRAVYAMYTDGVVPLTVLHFYLQKAEVIPEWLDVDLFKSMLDDESEFKNNPDAIAKMKGYNTAKDRVDARLQRRTLRNDEKITSITGEQVQTQADLERERLVHEAEEAERQRLADAAEAEKDRKLEKEKADQAAKTAAAAAKAMASRPAPAPGQNPQNRPAAPAAPAVPRKPGGSGGR